MLTDSRFIIGLIVGMAAVWAYHAFVNPLPTTKTAG